MKRHHIEFDSVSQVTTQLLYLEVHVSAGGHQGIVSTALVTPDCNNQSTLQILP